VHDTTHNTTASPGTTNAQSDHFLPEAVIQNIKTYFGQAGLAWAHNFPRHLKQVTSAWGLTVHTPFPNLSINFVAPVTLKKGGAAVLKMGFPHTAFATKYHALRHFNGQGAVELLSGKPLAGQMLLASVQPGTPLSQVPDDDQATRIAATTMEQLWRPADDPTLYPTIHNWLEALPQLRQRFNGTTGPFDPKLFDSAERISAELLSDAGAPVLLHGD
jgi:streptomycin 6-kinase